MDTTTPANDLPAFPALQARTRTIAREVAVKHATDVDANSRFPQETVDALRAAGLLSAPVPREHGGAGLNMSELGVLCSTLSQGCGSSGMVLAMHYIQVAAIARHCGDNTFFCNYLREIVATQPLLASITSEVGTYGDTRSSICAVEVTGDRFVLNKEATTGSYCGHADAILVTARRNTEAPKSDQVLVLVKKGDFTLTQTTTWDTMGMRGTVSPGFSLKSSGPVEQMLPGSFADSAAQSMVPFSHILWSSLWWGIAADAIARAATYVRGEARKNPGVVPPTAVRLAEAQTQLQTMKHHWMSVAREFDEIDARPGGRDDFNSMSWALKMTSLKCASSDAAPQIVHRALQIVGLLGYKNDTPFSLSRHYRDSLSASLMVSNERITAKSASMLLVLKDD